jgi:hypothetical protein
VPLSRPNRTRMSDPGNPSRARRELVSRSSSPRNGSHERVLSERTPFQSGIKFSGLQAFAFVESLDDDQNLYNQSQY